MKNKKTILIIIAVVIILGGILMVLRGSEDRWMCVDGQWVKHGVPSAPMPTEPCGEIKIESFDDCVLAGNPIIESYPRQCRAADGEVFVEQIIAGLSREEAFDVARESQECANTGVLTDRIIYNENSKTWWIDLERMPELEKDGCNPACVVFEETKIAEVNWRCTGLVP